MLEIRTVPRLPSKYRILFDQDVWREGVAKPIASGHVEMVCVDKANRLIPVPEAIVASLAATYQAEVHTE